MLVLLTMLSAFAGPSDVTGLGARSIGRGGGGLAAPDGTDAALLNPAGLARAKRPVLAVGYGLLRADFDDVQPVYWDTNQDGRIDDTDTPLQIDVDPARMDGLTIAFDRPLGKRVAVGLVAFVPKDHLVLIASREPALPGYFLYDNRLQRFEIAAGAGVDVWKGIRVGGGAQVLAAAKVHIGLDLDIAVQGADDGDSDPSQLIGGTTIDVHDISLDVVPEIIPVAGFQWDVGQAVEPLNGLSLGAVWRGSGGLPVDIDVDLQADATVQDVGELDPITLAIVAPVVMRFVDHYIPSRLAFGASYRVRHIGRAMVDVERTAWSDLIPSVTNLIEGEIQSPLFQLEDPSIDDGNLYALKLEDTTGVRAGLELWPLDRELDRLEFIALTLRGGWGYQPSPVVSQGEGSAFLDADRMLASFGVGLEHGDPTHLVAGPICWDAYVQGQVLASGDLDVGDAVRAGAPRDGEPFPIGGQIWAAGLQWSFEY